MAQQLRTVGVLDQDPDSVPGAHMETHTACNFSSSRSDFIFWLSQLTGTHVMHIYYIHEAKSLIHMKLNIFKNKALQSRGI